MFKNKFFFKYQNPSFTLTHLGAKARHVAKAMEGHSRIASAARIFFEFFCMMRFYLNLYVVRSEKRKRFRLFRVLYNFTFKGINPLTDLLFFKNI